MSDLKEADGSSELYKVGDLVWAKMRGYTPWPGKVSSGKGKARKSGKGGDHYIFFFGTNNFSWIDVTNLKDYEEHKDSLSKQCKTATFKEACAAIEKYVELKASGEMPDEDLMDESDLFDSKNIKDDEEEKVVVNEEEPAPLKAKRGRKKRVKEEETNGGSPKEETPRLTPKKRKTNIEMKKDSISPTINSGSRHKSPIPGSSKLNNSAVHRSKSAMTRILDRPTEITVPPVDPIDVALVSQELKDKKIVPSKLKFGFLGLGIMGAGIAKNLLNSGHALVVWNRTPAKCDQFTVAGSEQGMTPSDVIQAADITFSCISDPQAAREMIYGNCGVLAEINATKNYVEMTNVDSEYSQDISEAIQTKGGRYLEAQIQGSRGEAESGNLVIVAAGNKSLFDECESAFKAMAKKVFFVGTVGNASKINLMLQMLAGITLAGVAEVVALSDRFGINQTELYNILKETSVASSLALEKMPCMIDSNYPLKQPLLHMQKDLNLALQLGNSYEQPLPVASAVNEVFKHAKRLGYGDQDVATVYYHNRF